MKKQELQPTEYGEYYAGYISKIPNETILKKGIVENKDLLIEFFNSIPEEKLPYRYLPEKWNIKEILQHIIDTERIFMYRMLRIARQDKTPSHGFDQGSYIKPSGVNNKSLAELLKEFEITRLYSINLINSIPTKSFNNMGVTNNSPISVRACAFILIGHSIWHMDIIKERYLQFQQGTF
ncbi:DinB family protein [Tenacibaculum gallaicum]|uniref:DinB family protein n=1 Tax=Tenacibaculum gallaicum TaxID=561505 RepID=A0A3E0HQN6_9FLAO|nr:DinB family protein [Tenacibaculum gallaicum]REH48728.1 DinB family protein [Tenacibaculum gallaicum]